MCADTDLFLFIDESGNFDFSAKGSRFFILTAVATTDPVQGAERLLSWRHHILTCDAKTLNIRKLRDCTYFHCTEDAQYTRDGVFNVISSLSFSAYSVVIQKNKTNPAIQTPHDLYERAFRGLVKGIVRRRGKSSRYRIFAADLELQPKKSAFLGTLKSALSSESGLRYHVHSHPAHSHHMLQVGDYICWAIARKWERGDSRSHALVASKIVVEFDFFRKGTTEYY